MSLLHYFNWVVSDADNVLVMNLGNTLKQTIDIQLQESIFTAWFFR